MDHNDRSKMKDQFGPSFEMKGQIGPSLLLMDIAVVVVAWLLMAVSLAIEDGELQPFDFALRFASSNGEGSASGRIKWTAIYRKRKCHIQQSNSR